MKIILLWKLVIRQGEIVYSEWDRNQGIWEDGWKYERF
jgi:hypothetical protein